MTDYDAGLLNDYGGGNVDWWQDYLRAEIGRANEHWQVQVDALTAERDALREALKRLVTIYEAEQDPDALVRPAWLKDVLEYNPTSGQKNGRLKRSRKNDDR